MKNSINKQIKKQKIPKIKNKKKEVDLSKIAKANKINIQEIKTEVDEIKTEVKERKKFLDNFKRIKVKLIASFAIPVLLILVLGVVTYTKASNAIIHNYEQSTSETIKTVSQYMNLMLQGIDAKSLQLMSDSNLTAYYGSRNDIDSTEDEASYTKLKTSIATLKSSDINIYSISVFGNRGNGISTSGTIDDTAFQKFVDSKEGQTWSKISKVSEWTGSHTFLDETLGISDDQYALSLTRKFSNSKGYIIVDIQRNSVTDVLENLEVGKGSIIGLVSGDGREVLVNTEKENIFASNDYYQKSMTGDKTSGYSYETYNGEKYLYIYSKIGTTGASICSMIPKATITRQADDIKTMTLIIVILACIIATLIGFVMSNGIAKSIILILESVSKASRGDLTGTLNMKRRDEFGVLGQSISDMLLNMRNLIKEVANVGVKVMESADGVSRTSSLILDSTKGISTAIDEIETGAVSQASDSENCLNQMDGLAEKINLVYNSTYEIEQIANDTKSIVTKGIEIVDDLNKKSTATSDITKVVINDIEKLDVQSSSIGNIVSVINDISSQTNLLSLNASIEAARAGAAGRGFAVVADEIRKLAEQTMEAANQITDIVIEIQSQTKGTVVTARQAEDFVSQQAGALDNTVKLFNDINLHVENLSTSLYKISGGVKGIEEAKDDTLEAIRNISDVSQESAAAAEEVSATSNNQITSVEDLNNSASELAEDAAKLQEAIRLFKID